MSDLVSWDTLAERGGTVGALVGLGLLLSWVTARLARRFERRIVGSPTSEEAARRGRTLAAVLRAAVLIAIWVIVGISVLERLGVPVGPMLAAAGIGGIALGFGARLLVQDLVGGFCILTENQYSVGDEVTLGDVSGTVEAITLRTTVLRGLDGVRHVVSNGDVRTSSNATRSYSRAMLVVPLPYSADVDRAIDIISECGAELTADPDFADRVLGDLVVLGVDAFNQISVDIKAYVQTVPGQQHAVGRELRKRVGNALEAQGIKLPYMPVAGD